MSRISPVSETVTDEMVTAAMRAFERMSSVLRYREKDKWHTCDIMGMRDALRAAMKARGHAQRSTVDAYSYNAGIEAAAGLCEVPVRPFDGGEVEPPAPLHAKWIREAKVGTVSDTSTDRRLPRDLIDREPNHGQYAPDRADVSARWEARPPHSDWRMIAPEHVDDYRAKDWEVRLAPSPIHEDK